MVLHGGKFVKKDSGHWACSECLRTSRKLRNISHASGCINTPPPPKMPISPSLRPDEEFYSLPEVLAWFTKNGSGFKRNGARVILYAIGFDGRKEEFMELESAMRFFSEEPARIKAADWNQYLAELKNA